MIKLLLLILTREFFAKVNGTTGEGTALSMEERCKVTEAWAAVVKETKQHLMIQIGGLSLNEAKRLVSFKFVCL